MANPIQLSCSKCELQSRIVWKKLRSEKVKCHPVHQFNIQCIPKAYNSHITIPCENNEKDKEKYELARNSISDPEMEILKSKKVHSWPRSFISVTALRVPRDGNSLCHAISVLVCGVIDQNSFFRRCLNVTCMGHLISTSPLCHRWTEFITQIFEELDKDYKDEALRKEWNQICFSSTPEPIKSSSRFREFTTLYSPLQQFHIFVMAQVCRRVIVVASLEEGGFKPSIYLPVTIPVNECIKVPLYIAHHKNHFAPLAFVQERDSGNLIRDLCVPIVDHNFQQYEFPYLYCNEDGNELLKLYTRVTTFGYTTTHSFNELPAIRIPDPDLRTVSGCVEAGVDPNTVINLCYEGLSRSGSSSDVLTIWNSMSDLKDKFQEDLPSATYLAADPQPLSIGMQPECDSDDSEHGDANLDNNSIQSVMNQVSIVSQDIETRQEIRDQNTFADSIKSNNHSFEFSDLSVDQICNDSNFSSECHPSENEHNAHLYLSRVSVNSDEETPLKDVNSSKKRQKISKESSSASTSNISKKSVVDLDKSGACAFPFSRHRLDSQSTESSYLSCDGTGNSFNYQLLSPNHVFIKNPDQIILFVSKLELREDSVVYRLEKKGLSNDDKVQLLLPNNQNKILFDFQITNRNELRLKLTKEDSSSLRLTVVLPKTVTCDRESFTSAAEPLVTVVEDIESPYFDFTNNPEKCRTAGCMNRAVKQYRNLCSSCNVSWMNMLRKSEEISSFSYYDSVSSIENRANDGSCKNKNCRRDGVPELYGFCQQCFNAPGL